MMFMFYTNYAHDTDGIFNNTEFQESSKQRDLCVKIFRQLGGDT